MKVYKKIILDKNDKVIYEDSYDYEGNWSYLGIHYTFGANKGSRLMEKKAKREKKLAEKRAQKAKKQGKSGLPKESSQEKTIPLDQVITLDMLTDPDKK